MQKSKRRMKRGIGHGMELRVVADPGVPVIEEVIRVLERYLKWCRESISETGWQYDGGQGSGREVNRRSILLIHVGPKTCDWDESPPYPARIEAITHLLALAEQVKAAGGDIEELREMMRTRR